MNPAGSSSSLVETEWPALPLEAWQQTKDTLHMWMQVVGKIRLELAPFVNHWWQIPLYITSRGLTTSAMPYDHRLLEVTFDFLEHRLEMRTSEGGRRGFPLVPQPVAAFYTQVMECLDTLAMPVQIRTLPTEVPDPIPFEEDTRHGAYHAEYANRFWRILVQANRVFTQFRSGFIGKCSPVHFFWGAMDLAVTRFSGRAAPAHPGAPFIPLAVVREAYSHEVSSCGFWPGGGAVPEPAFYAYAYPEPTGYQDCEVQPSEAYYSSDYREFILPYEAVRRSDSPEEALLRFLESTYAAAADLAGWDRAALERGRA